MAVIASENQQLSFGINGERHTLADGINSPFVKAGTDPSPVPVNKLFDEKRDAALIAKGTHFFCRCHLRAVPLDKQSPRNPDYCVSCLDVVESERQDKSTGGWIVGDYVYVTGSKGYGLLENGQTICLGKESDIKESLATKNIPDSIRGLSRVVLEKIIIQNLEEIDGKSAESANPVPAVTATLRAPGAKQRNNQRVRPIITVRHFALNTKLPSIEQQFALHRIKPE